MTTSAVPHVQVQLLQGNRKVLTAAHIAGSAPIGGSGVTQIVKTTIVAAIGNVLHHLVKD